MNPFTHALLAGYYYGSLPCRRWMSARREADCAAPVMVLFYHRIADSHPSSWTMSPRQFARQIDWLKRHFELISLAEAQRRIRSGRNRRASVSITFDDGYGENCREALPLLIRERIPVTYFVASEHVLNGAPFPHDVDAGHPVRPNTIDELTALSRAGVEIGAHTRSHADLGKITDRHVLVDEIVTAREELQDALGRPISYLAFPYGQPENLSPEAFQVARESGYEGVCSAYGGYNFPGDDAFHLQRIHGDPVMLRMKNWLTVDPRKLRRTRRIAPAPTALSEAVWGPLP